MTGRSHRAAALAYAVVMAALGVFLGDRYIARLPNHAGYYLVPVEDVVRAPLPLRPRHTVFILVDGLRRDAAEGMTLTAELEARGQCRVSAQGSFTVSRPVYTLLSTGVEVDRAGARNNDLTAPVAVESVWHAAREAGLSVVGSSHLPWFAQLFPGGFDRFTAFPSHADDVFAEAADLADVNLYHPLYVDEAGHQHGASSAEYADAVRRADREARSLVARLDLSRDLVVLTADHGHTASGGHGGAQPEVERVLVCFAGRNVAHRTDRAPFDGRVTGPALAMLLGVRFPRHMRAGDDGLDVLPQILEGSPATAAYQADRQAAVERYREANRRALEGWLGAAPGTWSRLYAREARAQALRALGLSVVAGAALGYVLRRRRVGLRAALGTAGWIGVACAALWATHRLVLGDLDFTVINLRARFVPRAFVITFVACGAAHGAHALALRAGLLRSANPVTLQFALVGVLAAVNVGHVLVFGWPLGFPLPSATLRYFPFLGAIALAGNAVVAAGLVLRRGEGEPEGETAARRGDARPGAEARERD